MNSKKLSGNGLWESSRMLLPEHREALLQRRQLHPERKESAPSFEELLLIKQSVILPMLLTIIETNCRKLELFQSPLQKLYILSTRILMDRILRDITETKKLLKAQGIKVYEEEKVDDTLRVRFHCRGYEDSIGIVRDVVKSEISVRIQTYIKDMLQPLLHSSATE